MHENVSSQIGFIFVGGKEFNFGLLFHMMQSVHIQQEKARFLMIFFKKGS